MKNVLLLLPGAFSGVGGIEMFNRQVVRAFLELGAEQGFHVRTLLMNDRTADVDDRYVPRDAPEPKGYSRHAWTFSAAALRRALQMQPDIILFGHVHFARIAPVLRALSRRSRHWYLVYGIEVWRPLPPSIRRGLDLAERFLSISDYSRNELVKNGGVPRERIELLPCALDPVWQAQYAPRPEDPPRQDQIPPTLLTVARLSSSERYKGIDSVIRALPDVLRQAPEARYDVVGDGDDRPRLEALARELGVSDRVRFRGRLWPDELAAAYRDCTLFVMPSSKEGFGIVFLEAALFGRTSVAGRHGGTPEVVEDEVTGLLVERDDVAGLTDRLVRLLEDGAGRARMGAAAGERLRQRFTFASFRASLATELGVGIVIESAPSTGLGVEHEFGERR